MTTGQRIKARREELGISIDWLAERIGRRRSTVYRYENSEIADIPSKILQKIADCLETNPSRLLGWYEAPEDQSEPDEPIELTDFTGTAPVHQRIFYRREWLRMSRSELALATGLPDMESVEAIESGQTDLTPALIRRLAKGLDCTCAELVGCGDVEWSVFCHVWQMLNPK